MRRACLVLISLLIAVIFAAPAAQAASPHFKRGGEPTCTISLSGSTSSTTCKGTLAGLGNEDLLIDTTVEGFAVYQCQNNGGNTAPGQNKVLVGPVTAPTTIDSDAVKNGNVRFVTNPAVLSAPGTVPGAEAGCPNPNWTGVNPTLTVTSISMVISQGGVLLFTCEAADPDGLTGTVALAC